MSEKYLLDLLQDIWEEDGMFNYLKVNYVKHSKKSLSYIQNIIIIGLKYGVFEMYKCTSKNKLLKIEDFKKIHTDKALEIVKNQEAWEQDEIIYEVIFVDKDKWFNDLFNVKVIPKIFVNGID
ncbi:MAG: hypothetical protein RR710_09300 [Oscillospiraceae bacterium]